MQSRPRAKGNQARSNTNRYLLYVLVGVVVLSTAYYFVSPYVFPKPPNGPNISLSPSADIPGSYVSIVGKNLTASHAVTATFDGTPITFNGTCATDAQGALSGCQFKVVLKLPSGAALSSGRYNVTASDGTHSPSATFTVPSILPPASTVLVTLTSLGLGFATQVVTRRMVDLNAERRMRAEVSAFNKEKRDATTANDKAKLEKLKKRELQVRQAQARVSTSRLKVTAITFAPLLIVYYLMATFLGGYNVIVAFIPVQVPLLAGAAAAAGGWQVSLFWWYFLSSFTFSTMLTKLMHTTT